ncbi:MAG: signal recognition particle protein Srp54 [Desulfurococcaceae archaeon]
MLTLLEGVRNALVKFIRGSGEYREAVEEFIKDLQRELIKSDINVKIVFDLTKKIKERALNEEPPLGVSRRDWLITIVYNEITSIFGGERAPRVKPPKKPWVIMLVGLQGSGKTTTAAKLALYYKVEGYRVGLIAADTFRPAAHDQLRQLGDKVGVPVFGDPKASDAIAIAKRGVEVLKEKGFDIIIIDTAGRHHREEDLLEEMKKMANEVRPDEVTLVLDASIGQQAYSIARKFHEATPIGSIILAKLDGTAKGGGALSAVVATGAQIKFIGTGEKIDDLEVFNPPKFVARMLGVGDVESLVEKVKRAQLELTEKDLEEMLSGKMNMRLIYRQLVSVRKLGPFKKILQMIPGVGLHMPLDLDLTAKQAEEKTKKWIAAINSMTYEELDDPSIIDKQRAKRIAMGAGIDLADVRELLKQYEAMRKMMRQLRKNKDVIKRLGLDLKSIKGEAA